MYLSDTFASTYSPKNLNSAQQNIKFNGMTRVLSLSDSHQRADKKIQLLNRAIQLAKKYKNVLFVDCGDICSKGPWPIKTEVDTYIKAKQLAPNLEMVFNMGNNDYKNLNDLSYIVKRFSENGIPLISMNAHESLKKAGVEGVKPYTVVNRGGDRILVAGFCVADPKCKVLNFAESLKCIDLLKSAIAKEKPDGVIVMNHDVFEINKAFVDEANKIGINIDLFIGGHEHKKHEDVSKRIFHTAGFNKEMFEHDLLIKNKISSIKSKIFHSSHLKPDPSLKEIIDAAANEHNFYSQVTTSKIKLSDLSKSSLSTPSELGTFVADGMRKAAGADAAFFSNKFLEGPLHSHNGEIRMIDVHEAFPPGSAKLQKVKLNAEQIKLIFENSLLKQSKAQDNARFIQYSSNVKIIRKVGKNAEVEKSLTSRISQIYIDKQPLYNIETGKPLHPEKTYTFAIDSYLSSGRQHYNMLKNLDKEYVYQNNEKIPIQSVFIAYLKEFSSENPSASSYKQAKIKSIQVW